MNYFEITVIHIILVTFPIFIWLFFMTHNKNIGRKENDLFLDFALFTILYLIVKYSPAIINNNPILVVNLPLILALIKKRYLTSTFLSIATLIYYNYFFGIDLLILILIYIISYLIYFSWIKLNYKKIYFLFSIISFKSLMFILWIINNQLLLEKGLFLIILLSFSTFIALKLSNKGEEVLKYHMTLKELEQEKQIRTTLFKITHEIKNPIAVCKGYLDMYDINNINHSKKYVPIIKEEIERTLILLQDFLSMNKIKINKEIIDINMVLEDVMDNFIPILKENNIVGEFNISEDSIYMYGDYNRLIQTFINIIKNSVEARDISKKSSIKVDTITGNDYIKIYIIDNGLGISKENINKINEPFFTTKNNGTGLGVSLSYEIISAHNGKISYISEEGIGTTVEIILPIIKKEKL